MSENIPKSIGIIMDGNRRWAKGKSLLPHDGHKKGYETFKEVLNWCKEKNINNVFVYAFSSENWNRSEMEVEKMMDLLRYILNEDTGKLREEKVQVSVLGDIERFPEDIQEGIRSLEEDTKEFSDFKLGLCLSYGGRGEVVNAVNKIIESGVEKITEEDFSNYLWSKNMPDPDLIIRTSGEKRLSGFLPWQGVYSELFFIDTYWPDFSKEEFEAILNEYAERDRRNGK